MRASKQQVTYLSDIKGFVLRNIFYNYLINLNFNDFFMHENILAPSSMFSMTRSALPPVSLSINDQTVFPPFHTTTQFTYLLT